MVRHHVRARHPRTLKSFEEQQRAAINQQAIQILESWLGHEKESINARSVDPTNLEISRSRVSKE